MFGRWEENCALVSKIDFHPRRHFQLVGEFGIQAGTGSSKWLKGKWCFESGVHQHSAGSVRGFAAGFPAFDNENRRAPFAQGNGE